jgi:hypothetical protein
VTITIVSGWVHKRMNVGLPNPSEKKFPTRRQSNKFVRDMFANECGMQDFCVTSAVIENLPH